MGIMALEATEEKEFYTPGPDVIENALIKDRAQVMDEAQRDLVAFWDQQGKEFEWFEPYTKVLDDSKAPFYQWYTGGKLNIVYNCLDRHVQTWRRNKIAMIWEGEK